jgi:sigma-E factor negative regulatory protein RseC
MKPAHSIGHEGVVERVVNGAAFVSVRHDSGCAGCSAKSSCGMADSADKVFKIPVGDNTIREGERVTVNISIRSGFRAVVVGYLVPFGIVVATLVSAIGMGVSEAIAGIISLAMVVPYYLVLKIFSKYFSNELSIQVQKP